MDIEFDPEKAAANPSNRDGVLQAERGGKSRITIRVDNATLAFFKARAAMTGSHYQTLMNEALQQFAQGQTLADVVRDTLREELRRT